MKLKTLTKKNKRGAVTDLFVWMIVCFVIVVILGSFYYMGNIVLSLIHI